MEISISFGMGRVFFLNLITKTYFKINGLTAHNTADSNACHNYGELLSLFIVKIFMGMII